MSFPDYKKYIGGKRGLWFMCKTEWIRCPVCGNKTRLQIREDTELKNFPLYCPKCKQESLVEVKQFQIKIIREPDA